MNALLLAALLAHGADTSTSLAVWHQGGHETNPIMSNRPAVFLLQKAAYATAEQLVIRKVNQHHHRLATMLVVASLSATSAAVVYNSTQLHH